MKVLTAANQQKLLNLLQDQLAASYQRFESTHEAALMQMETGLGSGFSTAIGIINKAVEEDGRFTEDHLGRILSIADCENNKLKRVEDADDNTRIFWRHEVAALMTAYTLIKSYMAEAQG